jgi:hypothetical protein
MPVPFCLCACGLESTNQADEPRGDSSQPTDPLCLDHGRYYDQLCAPSLSKDVIMYDLQNMIRVRTEPVDEKNSGRLEQPGGGASSSGGLTSTCFVFFFFFFFLLKLIKKNQWIIKK